MKISRQILSASLATGLALTLAACSGAEDADSASLDGDAIAAIEAPDGQSWNDVVNVSDSDGYVIGNPDAPLKLVEYASHTCGACALFSTTGSKPLKDNYVSTGVVSLELRNLVRDPIDLAIATLVRCGDASRMQPLSDQAWASFDTVVPAAYQWIQQAQGLESLTTGERMVRIGFESGLVDFFAARGLSSEQARTCLADGDAVEAIAQRSQAQSQELGVTGTPTFILNGQILNVNQWEGLEPVLQRAGAR